MKILKSIGLSVGTLAVLCILTEFAFRVYWKVPLFTPIGVLRYQPNQWYGYGHVPGQRLLYFHAAGVTEFRTDSLGFVGREHRRNPGARNVWILGDSYIEGAQMNWYDNLTAVLEKKFLAAARPARIFNAGVAGWNPEQMAQFLKHPPPESDRFRPSRVVFTIFIGNDIETLGNPENRNVPAALLEDTRLVWRNIPLKRPPDKPTRIVSPFFLTKFISRKIWILKQNIEEKRFRKIQKEKPSRAGQTDLEEKMGYDPWKPLRNLMRLYQKDPRDPSLEQRWEILDALLKETRDDCRRRGILFYVMIIPERREVEPEIWRLTLETLGAASRDYDPSLPRTRLLDLLKKNNIPYLDLYPAFHNRRDIYLKNDGHFTKTGHRVSAERLFDVLQAGIEPAQR